MVTELPIVVYCTIVSGVQKHMLKMEMLKKQIVRINEKNNNNHANTSAREMLNSDDRKNLNKPQTT